VDGAQGNRQAFDVSVAAIVLFQAAALVARSALEVQLERRGVSDPSAGDLSYLVVPPILLVLMAPCLRQSAPALAALFRPRDLTGRTVLLGIALGLDLRVLHWAALTLFVWAGGSDTGAIAGPLLGFACPPLRELLLALVVMSVLTPLVEETMQRGFVLHALLPRGRTIAVIVSAVTFALLHAPAGYAAGFVAGVLFAMQALNLRTLWAPVVAHATYNTAMVLDWRCARIVWNPAPDDPLLGMLAALSIGAVAAGAVLALWLASRKAAGETAGGRLRRTYSTPPCHDAGCTPRRRLPPAR
jgi:membrane protease YdiL (CAAX protease family)